MEQINILIVDDDIAWINEMKLFLSKQPEFLIIDTVSNCYRAIEVICQHHVDVVLMDIHLRGEKFAGITAATQISLNKSVKIIMLASQNEEAFILKTFADGAFYFVQKNDFINIPDIIRFGNTHGLPFQLLLQDYRRLLKEKQLMSLTPAEREIYELLEEGWTQKQIREQLYKSESTLKNQIRFLLKKLGAKSTKEAVQIMNSRESRTQ